MPPGPLLFGGDHGDSGQVYDDTWTFDGAGWTQLQVVGPSGRAGAVMAPLNGRHLRHVRDFQDVLPLSRPEARVGQGQDGRPLGTETGAPAPEGLERASRLRGAAVPQPRRSRRART